MSVKLRGKMAVLVCDFCHTEYVPPRFSHACDDARNQLAERHWLVATEIDEQFDVAISNDPQASDICHDCLRVWALQRLDGLL